MARQHTFSNEPYQQPIYGNDSEASGQLNDRIGALFTWNSQSSDTVKSRVGVSFISVEKACVFKDKEIQSWAQGRVESRCIFQDQDAEGRVPKPYKLGLTLLELVLYAPHAI